jgi:hypothetical protein
VKNIMLDDYRTEKSFCPFPAFTYWQLYGKPVSSSEAEYGLHPDAVLCETEQAKYFYDALKLHLVNKLRSKTPCLACDHSGESHLHTNRYNEGYAECKVEGCQCKWFNADSEIWESL